MSDDAHPTDEQPQRCRGCGYDRRGLPERRLCPECGLDPALDRSSGGAFVSRGGVRRRPLVDLLDTGASGESNRWVHGLALGALTMFAAAFGEVAVFIAGAVGGGAPKVEAVLVAVLAGLWTIAGIILLPVSIARSWPWMAPVRLFAAALQPLWIVVGVGAVFSAFGIGAVPFVVSIVAGLGALAGTVCLIVLLSYVAEEAEMHPTARRLNLVTWALPLAAAVGTVVLAAFPSSFQGLPSGPWGLVAVIIMLPPFACVAALAWLQALCGIGMLEMRHHARWGQVHVEESRDRQTRIEAKRAALQRRAAGVVRELPSDRVGHEVTLASEDRVR